MNFDELSQPHLAAAVVDRCGGRSEAVPWENVAVAIWRAFPDRASLRRWQLPDTYSIQTWVWDAKTKFGLLEGGNREGGWRVTERGARWLDEHPSVAQYVRSILLDEFEYQEISPEVLVLQCCEPDRPSSRPSLVIEAFRRFPAVFALGGGMFPDAAAVDRAISTAVNARLMSQDQDNYALTREGRRKREAGADLTQQEQERSSSRRRSIAGQYAHKVEATQAYRTYLDTGDLVVGEETDYYRMIQCPPNAGLALIEASVSEVLSNLALAGRPDLEGFVRTWTQRVVPELAGRGLVGGEKK